MVAPDNGREAYLSLGELCTWLKLKPSWVYGRVHAKALPFEYVKLGKYLLFPESSVKAYLERETRAGAA